MGALPCAGLYARHARLSASPITVTVYARVLALLLAGWTDLRARLFADMPADEGLPASTLAEHMEAPLMARSAGAFREKIVILSHEINAFREFGGSSR